MRVQSQSISMDATQSMHHDVPSVICQAAFEGPCAPTSSMDTTPSCASLVLSYRMFTMSWII